MPDGGAADPAQHQAIVRLGDSLTSIANYLEDVHQLQADQAQAQAKVTDDLCESIQDVATQTTDAPGETTKATVRALDAV